MTLIRISFYFFVISILWTSSIQGVSQSLNAFLKNQESPLICGHRGGYYPQFPENSQPLFDFIRQGIGQSNFMLEIDIRKSLDGELMVAHDADLTRTAGVDVSVPDLTVEQLKKYPLLDGHGTPTTVTMLSFKEVLAWAYQKNVFLMLDVKGDFWKQVQEMLETYHMEDRCCILTFSQDSYLSAFSYLKKTAISVLVSTTDQYEDFIGYQNSNPSIMAYVTLDTPLNILDSLRNQKTFLLSDPREVWKGITTVAEKSFYENFISTLSLHILVTDFPIEVYQYFLK